MILDDLNEGLTQEFIDCLCANGEIGNHLEAEDEKTIRRLNMFINQGDRPLSFVLTALNQESNIDSNQHVGRNNKRQKRKDDRTDHPAGARIFWYEGPFNPASCALCMAGPIINEESSDEDQPPPVSRQPSLQQCKGCRQGCPVIKCSVSYLMVVPGACADMSSIADRSARRSFGRR